MKAFLTTFVFLFFTVLLPAQSVRFAHITDTHVGGSTGAEDLKLTINDINSQSGIQFVVLTGDVTEFGSEKELLEARQLLSELKIPYYIIPGNHDSKWSESGCNDFTHIFGDEKFSFEKNGFLFIGTASGPNMRMSPGLVPREHMIFLEKTLKNLNPRSIPVINFNHYPIDASIANHREFIQILKTANTRITILGHGHSNKKFDFNGISGVMGRSNLRDKNKSAGYNIVAIENDTILFSERISGKTTLPVWCKIPLNTKLCFTHDTVDAISEFNSKYPQVKIKWKFREDSDVGGGIAVSNGKAIFTNTKGEIVCINAKTGKSLWRFQTGGKIYSTPAIRNQILICPSTDNNIYALDLKKGKQIWRFETKRPIVATPAIDGNSVFIGSSEGIFRSVDLSTGKLNWQFSKVENFVECKPLVYEGLVYFGSWGNTFYALNRETGQLVWERKKYTNRMLSPAAVWPVAANGKIFIVAPDRRISVLDSKTGIEILDSGTYSCRESIGISADKKLVYIKTMTEGKVIAFQTSTNIPSLAWECDAGLGYDIAPSLISESGNAVLVATDKGIIVAIDKTSRQVVWKYKLSEALINGITPLSMNCYLVSTLDGHIACIEIKLK